MQISDRMKRILNILLVCIVVVCGDRALGIAIEPISYAYYFNHDIREIERSHERSDLVFVGASRVYRSFIPSVFEKKLGMQNVINGGSSSQPISGSYYQMKELMEKFHPRYVVLGVSGDILYEDKSLQANLIVSDRLHGKVKLQHAMDVFSLDELPNVFSKTYRFGAMHELTMKKNIMQKFEQVINGYTVIPLEDEYYADTGFVYNGTSCKQGNISYAEPLLSGETVRKENIDYLDKIVKLCADNDAKLFLVTAPTSLTRIYASPNYEQTNQWFIQYADQNDLSYYNLNYLQNREDIIPDTSMFDYNHLNGKGAETISEIYADILNAEINNMPIPYEFYDTEEEMRQEVKRIVAVNADLTEAEGQLYIAIHSLQNPLVQPEYALRSLNQDGTESVLVDWTHQNSFSIPLPVNCNGRILVLARTSETDLVPAFHIYDLPGA